MATENKDQIKRTVGRQKIEMKTIEKKSKLNVTFSKRRSGLFKKASELSLLTGAEVAIITFSPGGKTFAFGNPDVDLVVDRYTSSQSSNKGKEVVVSPRIEEAKKGYQEALKKLEYRKLRIAEIEEGMKCVNKNNDSFWWDEPIDNMGLEELKEYEEALKRFRENVITRMNELVHYGDPTNPNVVADDSVIYNSGSGNDKGSEPVDAGNGGNDECSETGDAGNWTSVSDDYVGT